MSSSKLLSSLAKNNVLPLSLIRTTNYPLFMFFNSHKDRLTNELDNLGVAVFDDLTTKRSPESIKLYLLFHFGEKVNLTTLRKKHRTIYNYLGEKGNIKKQVSEFGFDVEYEFNSSEIDIVKELEKVSENGIIKTIDSKLYDKIFYKSRKLGQSVNEFIEELGFKKQNGRCES